MSPKSLRPLVLAAAVLGGLAATTAFAFGPGPGGPPGLLGPDPIERLEAFADEIDLSADQLAAIREILTDAKEQGEALRAEHEGLRAEGLALFAAEEIDRKAAEKHRQAMVEAADEGSQLFVDTAIAVAEVLTPEQRKAIAAKVEQFHEDGGWRERIRAHMQQHVERSR